jgi:hypothetical protein
MLCTFVPGFHLAHDVGAGVLLFVVVALFSWAFVLGFLIGRKAHE